MNKITLLIAIVLVIVSGDVAFQVSNVVAYYNFSKDTVLATRLVDIALVDVSRETLAKGYFTGSFMFENPTDQTLNLTSLVAEYYQTSGSVRIGLADMQESRMLGPGRTPIVLQVNVNPTTLLLPQPFYWLVKYNFKFGSAYYSFTSSTYTSVTETTGPFSVGEAQAFTQVVTYTLLVVDVWAVGLVAVAVLTLLEERKIDKTLRLPGEKVHSRMLAILFGLQGFGLVVFWPFSLYLLNSVVYQPPVEFPYGAHGAAGIATFFLLAGFFAVGLIFLGTSAGLLLHQRSAKSAAFFLASISVLMGLYLGFSLLTGSSTAQNTAFAALLLALAAANGIALYILFRPPSTILATPVRVESSVASNEP